jgi:ketosteroid isomerase-like protein
METQRAARRWAETWTTASLAHEVEAVVGLYAEDCVQRSTPFRRVLQGREAVRGYVAEAFAEERRVDGVRFSTPTVEGDRAFVEYWANSRDQSDSPVTLAGCAIARFGDDGLVVEARDYWHLEAGRHEPPADWDR